LAKAAFVFLLTRPINGTAMNYWRFLFIAVGFSQRIIKKNQSALAKIYPGINKSPDCCLFKAKHLTYIHKSARFD